MRRAGTCSRQLRITEEHTSVSGRTDVESPLARRERRRCMMRDCGLGKVRFVFSGRDTGQTKKCPPALRPEGIHAPASERSVFRSRLRNRRLRWHFRFRAAQPPDGVGANAPEDSELRGLGFLGFAVLALVLGADELSVNQDMVALVKRVGNG